MKIIVFCQEHFTSLSNELKTYLHYRLYLYLIYQKAISKDDLLLLQLYEICHVQNIFSI